MGVEQWGSLNSFFSGRNQYPPPDEPPRKGCCRARLVEMVPLIFQPLIRRIFPFEIHQVSESSLHPVVDNLIESLLSLDDVYTKHITEIGSTLHVSFSAVQQQGNDLSTKLSVVIDEKEVFSGQLTLFGAYTRGKVTFAITITCILELLYLQLLEMAMHDSKDMRLSIGVIEIIGSVSNLGVIKNVVKGTTRSMVVKRKAENNANPGFDSMSMYGVFPSTDFGYFYGIGSELIDTRPIKGEK